MALLSTNETIQAIALVVFVLLLPFNGYNLFQHSDKKRAAYLLVLLFDVIRIVGNILLLVASRQAKAASSKEKIETDVATGGYILQALGYGFLVSACLSFYNRAIGSLEEQNKWQEPKTKQRLILALPPSRIAHLINTVATILLMVGLTRSDSIGSVDELTRIGSYLYCLVTALTILLLSFHLFVRGALTPASQVILIAILAAQAAMAIRAAYSAYRFQTNGITTFNVWAQFVFQDVVEIITVVIFTLLGFFLNAMGPELDVRKQTIPSVQQATV